MAKLIDRQTKAAYDLDKMLTSEKTSITIGRKTEGTTILDITTKQPEDENDLAYSVSRLHGEFIRQGKRWAFVDLGSSNGTRVIGKDKRRQELLEPHIPFTLRNLDNIGLGDGYTYTFYSD